jgi:hypothetical protein
MFPHLPLARPPSSSGIGAALLDDTPRLPRDRDAVKRGIAKTMYKKWTQKDEVKWGKHRWEVGRRVVRVSYQTKAPLVRRTPEGDQSIVAVVIGAELRQPQCPTAGELLQGGTAGLR